MAGIINEANQNLDLLKRTLEKSEVDQLKMGEAITRLSIHNIGLKNCLEELVVQLQLIQAAQGPAKDSLVNDVVARSAAMLESDLADKLGESRVTLGVGFDEVQRQRAMIREMEAELSSFRGGEAQRNAFLVSQINDLTAELNSMKSELQTSRSRVLAESRNDETARKLSVLAREN